MLTKDLLRFKTRNEKIFPQFVKDDHGEVLQFAEDMVTAFKSLTNKSYSEIEEELAVTLEENNPYFEGFKKLLFDRCEWHELESIEERRWEIIAVAKELRTSGQYNSLIEFQKSVIEQYKKIGEAINKLLFSDLPEFKKLKSIKEINAKSLIDRYNCAQVQGLLINSNEIKITLVDYTLNEKRTLFRWLKFYQLLVEVENESDNKITMKLSGPLTIFTNSQTYGLKLATFFPRILQNKAWILEARIHLKNKNMTLLLDHTSKLRTFYKNQTSYIPEEFNVFIEKFNEQSKKWQAEVGNDFLHLGRQSYCFPDIVFKSESGQKIYLELFHKWHFHQFFNRIKIIETVNVENLMIGICKSSAKQETINEISNHSRWFEKYGFVFNDFPTVKAVNKILNQMLN